jgi:predicted small lipoprotein YifL
MQGARVLSRPFFRLAVIGALAASFALGGCGRKGPLDPPPSALAGGHATLGNQVTPDDQAADDQATLGAQETSTAQTTPAGARPKPLGPNGKPIAPGMSDKRIPLDVLLN